MKRDERVVAKLRDMRWVYAPQDDNARAALEQRIVETAQRRGLVTYSTLVRGIEFKIASINGGMPFTISDEWSDLDRAVVGDFLGMINAEEYERDGLFLSALVVLKADGTPGPGFTNFMIKIGALRSKSGEVEFWAHEVARAHTFFSKRASEG